MLCILLLPANTIAAELFMSLTDYIARKQNWPLPLIVGTEQLPCLDGFVVSLLRSKKVTSGCHFYALCHPSANAGWLKNVTLT